MVLSGLGIQFLGSMSALSARGLGLRRLDLSRNALQSLRGLPPMMALEELDISFNALAEVPELPFVKLRVFNASFNQIQHVAARQPRGLEIVDLRGNPLGADQVGGFRNVVRLLIGGGDVCAGGAAGGQDEAFDGFGG